MQMVFLLVQNLQIAESISPDDIATEFAALKELKRTEEDESFDKVEVLEGNGVDFGELYPVEQGIIPQAILVESFAAAISDNRGTHTWELTVYAYPCLSLHPPILSDLYMGINKPKYITCAAASSIVGERCDRQCRAFCQWIIDRPSLVSVMRKKDPTPPPIPDVHWSVDMTWTLLSEVEKDENRLVLLGKRDKKEDILDKSPGCIPFQFFNSLQYTRSPCDSFYTCFYAFMVSFNASSQMFRFSLISYIC
ncbi:hypothetical protein DFJ58DRAFT_918841 [Suillus subalutaceus]|uniref:uncharacterized protein n=1 Tax=Suillus subalutaceus TaxID=48586 RepID=UPI001B85C7D3|nr:uncharacterized protein DFJ58DRAFT_918841 [Suillus subalutaceus]KAG1826387.1 hypothetical protein DFJ58DRAFT_918841 [Suillus subalutaceus]